MSVFKNVCSAHSEWSKMSVRDQDEEGKQRRASDAGRKPPIMPRGADLFLYKHVFDKLFRLASNFSLPFVFLILRRLTLFAGGLDSLAC